MVPTTPQQTDSDEPEGEEVENPDNLPVRLSKQEMHRNWVDAGMHPSIEDGDEYWPLLRRLDKDENGYSFTDGDKLIAFMKDNPQCPVCGRHSVEMKIPRSASDGRIVEPSYTFMRAAKSRNNPVVDRLEEDGKYPIVCSVGHNDYFLGVASKSATRDWVEWKDTRGEVTSFRKTVRSMRNKRYPTDLLGTGNSKGAFVAAIYDALGAENYDERDLMGRSSVTKTQLAAILNRVEALEIVERRDNSTEDWLVHREFGVQQGRVEWHYPEWATEDSLAHSGSFRKKLYE